MTEVRLDPQQAPARAELLLSADLGRQAPGRPIHGRLESEDNGAGDPGPRLTIGAVRTRRLAASEAATRPSGRACGNPLRGTRESAPTVPVGAPVIARTDVPDAHGWRAGPPTRCRASAGRCRPCPRRAPATSRASTA